MVSEEKVYFRIHIYQNVLNAETLKPGTYFGLLILVISMSKKGKL